MILVSVLMLHVHACIYLPVDIEYSKIYLDDLISKLEFSVISRDTMKRYHVIKSGHHFY